MRIEVLEGSEEPVIHPFNSTKLTIGSGENCDIILSASGISRKHLIVTSEDDKFFVIDQGSTNGSFINEERLIPGRKVEFTSFFPVRLGENTLISLLSDEEGMDSDFSIPIPKERTSPAIPVSKDHDSTTVINLRDLQKVKTETLVLERNKKREIRKKAIAAKKPPEKAKKKTNFVGILSLLIVAAAAYYNFFVLTPVEDEPIRKMGEVLAPDPSVEPVPPSPSITADLVDDSDIPDKEYLGRLLNNLKCTIEQEIHICDLVPGLREGKFGVTQVGLSLHILVDGSRYFTEALARVKDKSNTELVRQMAAYLFLMRMPNLNEEIVQDSRLIISMFRPTEDNNFYVDTVIAVKPSVLNREKEKLREDHLKQVGRVGLPALEFTKSIYKIR